MYQRPQHLLTRFSQWYTVYYMEEPEFGEVAQPSLKLTKVSDDLSILVPQVPIGTGGAQLEKILSDLLDDFITATRLQDLTFWYYTPMALSFSRQHQPFMLVYDCMDELSAFDFAPKELKSLEQELLAKADLVFTGGHSLYEAKKSQHEAIHPFPSSIERSHFNQAREVVVEPADQEQIGYPRLGFYGVLDERFDKELIREISSQRPDWQIVLIGPVVKIDPASLPQAPNIHYLGQKTYAELPAYLSGWDIALIPFLMNESTRYISPTKTPEYLAAGVPVVSTPIRDVVKPYATKGFVRIGHDPAGFIAAIAEELAIENKTSWQKEVDFFLAFSSWDKTSEAMYKLIREKAGAKSIVPIAS